MKKLAKITSALALCTIISSAHALEIDFIDLTENTTTGLGESAWDTLTVSDGDISADITASGFAYLDWGTAGLGDCGALNAGASTGANPGSSANLCDPGSDDNITISESVTFTFDTDVAVKFWVNNNHDGGFGQTPGQVDLINIGGIDYAAVEGILADGDSTAIGDFQVAANESITIKYVNEEFYLSAFVATSANTNEVLEPGVLSLLSISLLGLGIARRRRTS